MLFIYLRSHQLAWSTPVRIEVDNDQSVIGLLELFLELVGGGYLLDRSGVSARGGMLCVRWVLAAAGNLAHVVGGRRHALLGRALGVDVAAGAVAPLLGRDAPHDHVHVEPTPGPGRLAAQVALDRKAHLGVFANEIKKRVFTT